MSGQAVTVFCFWQTSYSCRYYQNVLCHISSCFCVHRDVQLVGELLHPDCRSGAGGEPDGLCGWKRPADSAEPSRGTLPQGLEVQLRQNTPHRRRGRLPSWPPLMGLLFNKAHCIVDEHLACSCHLNLIFLMQNQLAVLAWMNTSYFIAVSRLPANLLYIIAFLYLVSKHVIFLYCLYCSTFLREGWSAIETRFVQFISCLEHFVYFLLKMAVPSFNSLMQEIQHFQRGVYTVAMFTLLKLSALNVHV